LLDALPHQVNQRGATGNEAPAPASGDSRLDLTGGFLVGERNQWILRSNLRDLRDRCDDGGEGAIPVDIAAHPDFDFFRRSSMTFVDAGRAGNDLTGRAVAPLEGIMFDEGPLKWV
jgi:hypothetical protein